MSVWNTRNIPAQSGKFVIVTGANSGIGYHTALELARAGADVALAGRSEPRYRESLQHIRSEVPAAKVRFEKVDLSSLTSVAEFSKRLLAEARPIDLLINNAGVMMPPARKATADGFELQFGTNHLGHFALTAQLLPLLRRARQSRVVNVSSLAHRQGAIHFDDLEWARKYKPWPAYAQSKLANLYFTFEFQRRSEANGWGVISNAAHPGGAQTELIANGQGSDTIASKLATRVVGIFGQSATQGALPTLFAATALDANAAGYYGPNGFLEIRGAVAPAHVAARAKDPSIAKKLWEVSEQLTGVRWE
jgi:NAD(P)-dependent dehydrogenase (short-subunit alcohol dehydrogenase family)